MRWLRQTVLVPIALFAAAPWANAQGAVAGPAHTFTATARPVTPNAAVMRSLPADSAFANLPNLHHAHPNRLPLFPFGLFSGSLFPDYPSPAESPAAAQSPLNLMEALSALGKSPEPPPPVSQPLLIELRGDRYVRVTSGETTESVQDYQGSTQTPSTTPSKIHAATGAAAPGNLFVKSRIAANRQPTAGELPPAVLIFHDGHSEEARDYTIVDGILYARGDYYTDGYWNKKILLTALNLPETLKSNQARGVRFILPNAPNEVVTRP